MPSFNAEEQRRVREYEAPTFGYRLGADGEIEKEVFDGVIPKGWFDTPAALAPGANVDVKETSVEKMSVEEVEAGLEAPYIGYSFPKLSKELKRRTGKGAKIGTKVAALIERLEALDAG